MKRMIVVFCAILLVVGVAGCATNSVMARSNWSGTSVSYQMQPDGWVVSAETLHGHSGRTVEMSAEQLAALRVRSSNDSGEVRLTIRQYGESDNDNELMLELSGGFDERFDLSEAFEPGRIRLRLDYVRVEGLELYLRWGE